MPELKPKDLSDDLLEQLLSVYESGEARALVRIMLTEVLGISTSQVLVNQQMEISESNKKLLDEIITRLLSLEPIQYILGYAWFMEDKFIVNENVLIPRQETEELVRLILKEVETPKVKILDIGTGTGCIPIQLKKHIPEAEIFATEVSSAAYSLAVVNAETIGVDVQFFQSDILTEFPPISDVDIIVSNPPYVTEKEKEVMNWNVLNHEPSLALFVPDEDPLLFYRRIGEWAFEKLSIGGRLYFEINEQYGPQTTSLLIKQGFNLVRLIQDLSGKDRIVAAVK